MSRKRITQIFPWILPLRKRQRLFCFYLGQRFDGNRYAKEQRNTLLPYQFFHSCCPMLNSDTGFDMVYQENKVFNLKLAAKTLDRLILHPGETFSFWHLVRFADREIPYKEGLVVVDGKLQALPGGGLCQISNLLFWLFLHTPLTILERHGYRIKDFPEPPSDALIGVDATVSEGWLDLKVRNDTSKTFQITISFEGDIIHGSILTDAAPTEQYRITNGSPLYFRENNNIYEDVDIIQNRYSLSDEKCLSSKVLYQNHCKIGYALPADTKILDRKENKQ